MQRTVAGIGRAVALAGLMVACGPRHPGGQSGGANNGSAGEDANFPPNGPIIYLGGGSDGGEGGAASAMGPSATFSTYSIDFSEVGCGTSEIATVQILNQGDAPLTVSAMTTGTEFSASPSTVNVGVNALASLNVNVAMPGSATAGMRVTGSLNLITNDPSQPSLQVPLTATPFGATIALSAGSNSVAFPTSEVGQVVDQPFSLVNNGNGPANFTIGQPAGTLFALYELPDAGVTLNGGDMWTGTAAFKAPDTSMATATTSVTVSGVTCGTNLASITFTGEGGYGHLAGWPTLVDFGPADCGGMAPPLKTFSVTNTSNVDVLITSVSITPPDSGFATDLQVGKHIGAGASRTILVAAPPVPSPSPLTPITATLSIQTDADPSPHTITLQEEPRGAVLAFDTSATPNFGSFGGVVLLQSAAQNFAVTNKGTVPAQVRLTTNESASAAGGSGVPGDSGTNDAGDAAALDATVDAGADATVAPPQPFTIADTTFTLGPNGTQTDSVTFVPNTGGSFNDQVSMTASGAICSTLPSPLALSGVGLGGGPSITPSALAFPATCGGGQPATQYINVSNQGPRDMTWAISAVTGPGAAQYNVTAYPGLLPPGQASAITVTAAAIPSPATVVDPSALSAQFTITTDVPLDSPHVVALTETPIGDSLSFSVQSIRFGQWPIEHMSPPQTFTVTNAANAGSNAAGFNLVFNGDAGAVYVEPLDGGIVCIVPDGARPDGGDGGDAGPSPYCPLPPDAGDAGDAGDSGDGGDAAPPEYVTSGYVFAPSTIGNLGPSGAVSLPQTVTFVPTAPSSYPATISIQTSDPLCSALPAPLQLSGAGTQGQVSVSPATVTFGSDPKDPLGLVNCGATGLTNTITVSNAGNQAFNITGLSLGLGASSPYTLSGAGASPPALIPIGGSVSIVATPRAIPANVANPNDPTPFSDTLTISTDAAFDTPHTVSFVMQARGAVIANRALATHWDFGTINLGSIGTLSSTIGNSGNAPASVSLRGLTNPSIFALQNNPTAVVANGVSAFVAQFIPPAADGSWSDQGTLVVTTSQAFCQPLPAAWNSPTIQMTGSSSSSPPITVAGSLAFPSTECGSAAPAGQTLTIANNTNQGYSYSLHFSSGAYYTMTDAGPGTIAAGAKASVVVTPKTVAPAQGVQPGAAPYADNLIVTTWPTSAGGPVDGAGATAPSFAIPISWTLNGAVLALPRGAGPRTDSGGAAFYPADTTSGYTMAVNNTGTEAATVSLSVAPTGAVALSPTMPLAVPVGGSASVQVSATGSDGTCPTVTSAKATFSYSGSICQPLQLSQVTIDACQGTLH